MFFPDAFPVSSLNFNHNSSQNVLPVCFCAVQVLCCMSENQTKIIQMMQSTTMQNWHQIHKVPHVYRLKYKEIKKNNNNNKEEMASCDSYAAQPSE